MTLAPRWLLQCATTTTTAPTDDANLFLFPFFFASPPSLRPSARTFLAQTNAINITTSQVTHMYSHGNGRNDHTVLHYGFLDRSRWEQPRVCCSDLEGGNLWNCNAVDRDFKDLGAWKDKERVATMRRSKTRRRRRAPKYRKKGY